MPRFTPDAVLDLPLERIAQATTLVVCSGQPANFAGVAALALADVAVTPGSGNGDFTIGNSATSGRRLTVAEQPNVPIDTSGTGNHVAFHDGTTLLHVAVSTAKALTAGDTVTLPTFGVEFADPTAPA